ncbi:MAG: DegT/DnrJ/EryC1/StrS family aminotransferase [candidate division Zixibacteria bacterium]|nr:DegT/DnrJ/EryC1/StrS family aminotransferase [Candidatus Tariuqbacter arcticus]
MKMLIEFYKHSIEKEEKKKVLECLNGIFLTTGAYVAEFEDKFARYLRLKHSVGLNSCTAALHLSLLALDVGYGDEVITTPMTFIATAIAIMHTGAKPVFVDVEESTGLINPDLIEGAITEKTKAIVPVHLYGQMCDMLRIKEIADKYGLRIVEDAAHCIEGERDRIKPGHLGDAACFSFYATKNITSGEGGAVCTNYTDVADRIRLLRTFGMSEETSERYSGKYRHWDMIECGWKFNMSNIQASLLLPQLNKIDTNWEKRDRLYKKYIKYLEIIPEINYPIIVRNSKSAYHLFTVWVNKKKRDNILRRLGEAGIGISVNYRAIHLLTYFKETFGYREGDLPIAEDIGKRTISLPFWLKLDSVSIEYIISKLKNTISGRE